MLIVWQHTPPAEGGRDGKDAALLAPQCPAPALVMQGTHVPQSPVARAALGAALALPVRAEENCDASSIAKVAVNTILVDYRLVSSERVGQFRSYGENRLMFKVRGVRGRVRRSACCREPGLPAAPLDLSGGARSGDARCVAAAAAGSGEEMETWATTHGPCARAHAASTAPLPQPCARPAGLPRGAETRLVGLRGGAFTLLVSRCVLASWRCVLASWQVANLRWIYEDTEDSTITLSLKKGAPCDTLGKFLQTNTLALIDKVGRALSVCVRLASTDGLPRRRHAARISSEEDGQQLRPGASAWRVPSTRPRGGAQHGGAIRCKCLGAAPQLSTTPRFVRASGACGAAKVAPRRRRAMAWRSDCGCVPCNVKTPQATRCCPTMALPPIAESQ